MPSYGPERFDAWGEGLALGLWSFPVGIALGGGYVFWLFC